MFLKVLQNSKENTCARVSFLINLQVETSNVSEKETLPQVFSYKFCEISNKNLSYRTPSMAASEHISGTVSHCVKEMIQNEALGLIFLFVEKTKEAATRRCYKKGVLKRDLRLN